MLICKCVFVSTCSESLLNSVGGMANAGARVRGWRGCIKLWRVSKNGMGRNFGMGEKRRGFKCLVINDTLQKTMCLL